MTTSAAPRYRDRLQILVCALVASDFVIFVVNFRSAVGPQILVSLPVFALAAIVAGVTWQAWRSCRDRVGRRFWRTVWMAEVFTLTGQLIDVQTYTHGPTPATSPLQVAYSVVPFLLVLGALYRVPLGTRSRGERQRVLLDTVTVTVGASVVVWYISRVQHAGGAAEQHAGISSVTIVLVSVVLFALIKVIMSGSRVVDPRSLRLFSTGLLVEVAGIMVAPFVPTRPTYSVELLVRCLTYALMVAAARRQWRAAGQARAAEPSGRRPFSFLPYVAVAAVDALLLATLSARRGGQFVIAVAAVALTGLVIVRQIGAFRYNANLLGELGRQEKRFRSLVQNAADVIAIVDRDGIITYVSPGVRQFLGRSPDELIGTPGPPVHPDDQAAAEQAFAAALAEPDLTPSYEMRVRHTDLGWRRVRVTVTNMLADPAVGGIVTNSSDITEAHAYHSQLSHQASHDSLTDLANRSLFGEQLERALDGAGGRPVSLALVDLDDFKAVNDTLGHQAGDALLIAVAERLRRGVRPQDLVARLGGDEFAVLLDGVGATRVEAIAERMLGILTEPLRIDGHEVCVQASVGLAEAGPGDGAGQLLRLADVALYEAKGAGKGRYVRYAEHMQPRMSARAESAADLRRALQAGEFELYYQPIVALPSGRLTGVEALLRWHHPVRGLVPPLDFIPVAEQTGMIVPIGHWVLVQACRDMAAWLARYPDTAPEVVNVNVAPRQLRHPGFVDEVLAALAKAGLPASRLVIELIESTIVEDVNPQLGRLREAGVRIALDDFGTGQSTLSLLDACPVDELKLDRSFVREPGQDKVATVVARMAEALGVYAVAEGVETREQAEHLHSLGYGLAQGFHFARPVPAADLTELLRRGSSLAATTAPAS